MPQFPVTLNRRQPLEVGGIVFQSGEQLVSEDDFFQAMAFEVSVQGRTISYFEALVKEDVLSIGEPVGEEAEEYAPPAPRPPARTRKKKAKK